MSDATVREKIFDSSTNNGGWPSDGPITGLIEWLQKQRDLAPEEHRHLVQIDISTESGYGGDYWLSLFIYYYRPELPNETQERIARERGEAKRIEAKERAKLAALKRKYER